MILNKSTIAMISIVFIVAACHKFTGGGWIDGLNGGKAHFGFTAQCEDLDPGVAVRGQMQFNDKSAGVRFHGEFENYYLTDYESCDAVVADWSGNENGIDIVGSCWTQPGKTEGSFEVVAFDNNADGTPDTMELYTTCTPDGEWYGNWGELHGGNITAHTH